MKRILIIYLFRFFLRYPIENRGHILSQSLSKIYLKYFFKYIYNYCQFYGIWYLRHGFIKRIVITQQEEGVRTVQLVVDNSVRPRFLEHLYILLEM